jgi:hypothetical protein
MVACNICGSVFSAAFGPQLASRALRVLGGGREARAGECEQDYVARVRRTATRMPPRYLKALVQSMKRRCAALREAEGHNFEE